MEDDAGAAESQRDKLSLAYSLERLLRLPLPPPQIRIRPWWLPVQELRNPLVFYLEAWLTDVIFGPDRAVIPKMEWMSQALLTVNMVDSGNLVEITVFGRPSVQSQVMSMLLGLACFHREHRAQAEKMKHLEENLRARASGSHTPQHPIA
ncbi:PREDICTED: oocyte-expressed protein homolog isoform X1 [Propithecus coquereli]|uniref:oocyte-expressed protein homolog isoform X1 n=1 Tax=Propithecus coquereli TaxID=379532 RepID=UPI00063EEAB3|nr:PREDICTED: oocyte-expressed protein homolog isoform X1 [Propithecus coquereli]